MTTQPNCGWVKLWHRRGVHVTIPLSGDINTFSDQIDTLFENGWLATEPGLEAGEERGECGWVVHSRKDGRNGEVDVLDLYLVEDKFPKVRIYLNTQEDTQAFEAASGLRVSKMPIYVGTNKIERGASRQADQFVVKAPRPFGFVWKPNPKYNPDEKDAKLKKPARIFVRWADQKPKQEHAEAPADELPEEPRTVDSGNAAQAAVALALEKAAENGEEALKAAWRVADKEAREACRSMWGLLVQRAKEVDANRGF